MASVRHHPASRPMQALLSFLTGMGSILDIFGVAGPPPPSPQSEAEALAGDWVRIGTDLRNVMLRTIDKLPSTRA